MRRFTWAIAIAVALIPVLLVLQNRMSTPPPPPPAHQQPPSASRMEMKGFHYTGHDSEGSKVISIKGDRLAVEKKKIGFMRTALADQVIVRNATIELYGKMKNRSPAAIADRSPHPDGEGSDSMNTGLVFEGDLKRDFLKLFPGTRVSTITVEPIQLNLYGNGELVTQIQASAASIRLIQKDLLLKGDVKVKAGERTLNTEQLVLVPEGALIRTEKPFTYSSPGETRTGNSFHGDIFLNFQSGI